MNSAEDQVIELIRKQPKITAKSIESKLEIGVDVACGIIKAALLRGQITQERLQNGDEPRAYYYSINPSYLGWQNSSSAGVIGTTLFSAPVTRVGKAIAYLQEHGTATPEQINKAMGLQQEAYASTYLKSAIKRGVLHRNSDGNWALGASTGEAAPARATRQPRTPAAELPKATKALRPAKPEHIRQNSIEASMAVCGMQLIHWDNGNFSIKANDNIVDLDPDQARGLRAFISLT